MQSSNPDFDVLVVGSGPSGVHAAHHAVESGFRVALLDVGYTNPKLQSYIPYKPFSEIRKFDPEQQYYFLGDDPATVLRNQDRAGPHLTPARQHMIRNMDTLFPLESSSFLPLQATGSGGLGISWGANCFAFEDFELRKIGIPPEELRSFYRDAALETGVSGRIDDDTAPMLANMDHSAIQGPLPIDTNSETILKQYKRRRDKSNREGFFLGQSLLAMLSRSSGKDRDANPLFDMDYWADHNRSVYRPQWTLDKLKAAPNFTYLTNRLAKRFSELDGVVTIECRNLETGNDESFTARRLLLAAGAINSGKLALTSFQNFETKLPLLCNRNHWVAAINLSMLGRPARDERHSLSQLSVLMKTEFEGPDYVLAQIYSYRSLLWFRVLKSIPVPIPLANLFLRLVATAFTCINIHYPDRFSPNRWMRLTKRSDGDGLEAHMEFSDDDNAWLAGNERRLLLFLAKLRCVPLGVSKPMHGASIHYAGTLPYSDEDRPFTTATDGRLHGTQCVYVADGSSWRFLSGKGLTLTLMANARRVTAAALRNLKPRT